jgi:transcriptional regulator with XRE-family HTH domain
MFFKDSYDSFHSMCAVKVNTSLPLFFLTSAQIRAARSLIRWTAEDLASASALSVATIRRAELKKNQISPPVNFHVLRHTPNYHLEQLIALRDEYQRKAEIIDYAIELLRSRL